MNSVGCRDGDRLTILPPKQSPVHQGADAALRVAYLRMCVVC